MSPTRVAARVTAAALFVALACSDGPTAPTSALSARTARALFDSRYVYVGAPRSQPINHVRAIVYDAATGKKLTSLEEALDPAKTAFDFQLPIPVGGGPVNTRITIELAYRNASSEIVEYSGRRVDISFEAGDFRQVDIDLYPGPLDNFEATGVAITKPLPARVEGGTYQAIATVQGTALSPRVAWSSLDTTIATISTSGEISAVLPGTARIVAGVASHADTATIQVVQRRAGVRVTPDSADLARRGDTVVFAAKVVDPRGDEIVGETVIWSIANTAVATAGSLGKVEAVAAGNTTITAVAAADTAIKGTASVNVVSGAARVATLVLSPADTTLQALGAAVTYAAVARDNAGSIITGLAVAWSSSAAAVASVSSGGAATALANGTSNIAAQSDGVTATAILRVSQVASLAKSTLAASPTSVAFGGSSTITVTLKDANGNNLSASGGTVALSTTAGTLSSVTDNGDGTYGATLTGSAAGTATISGKLDGAALEATANVTFAAAATGSLALTTPAAGAASGSAFTEQPVVTIRDGAGNTATGDNSTVVTMTVSSGGTVIGTATATAVNGIVTFSTVGISGVAGTSYTLTFTVGSLTVTQSVTPTVGTATRLVLTTTASGAPSGVAFTVQPVVAIRDASGNTVTSNNSAVVTMTVSSGASVIGTATATASSGVATFSTVGITGVAGTAYTLTFASGSLTSATQPITASSSSATQLILTTSAAGAASGAAFTTQPVVVIRDVSGNTITSDNSTVVTMTVSSGGTVIGTATATASSGIATFSTVGISGTAGTTYTLTFSSGSYTSATQSITPTFGAGTQLALTTSAAGSASGAAFTTQPAVTIRDGAGNTVTSNNSTVVTMTVSSGGSVIGTATATASSGVATFSTVGITGTAGTSYTLTFASGSLTSATQSITPSAGGATQLVITTAAAGAASGAAFTTQPVVAIRDAAGNTVAGDNSTVVTMTVSSGGTVVGIATATASSGVATFSTVGISGTAGTSYTLTFTAGAITKTQSITPTFGTATQMVLTTSAAGAASGSAFTTQPAVAIRDAAGNTVTSNNSTVVTMTVSSGASVIGTATATASSGVATFSTVGISGTAGTSYTLSYSAGSFAVRTQSITPTAGTATKYLVTSSPSAGQSGATLVITAQLADAAGNSVTTSGVTVNWTKDNGTLGASSSTTDANGRATVNVTLDAEGTSHTVTATTGGNTGSVGPIVSSGTPNKWVVTAGSSSVASGGSTTITAQVSDASGNAVAQSGTSVTLGLTGSTGASLNASNGTTDANGRFQTTLTVSTTPANTHTVTATDGGILSGNTTVTVIVGPASASTSTVSRSPTSIAANGSSTSTITVQLKDANSNNLTSSGGTVTMSTSAGSLGSVTNNNNGTYTAVLTSSTSAASATVTATLLGTGALSNTATVTFGPTQYVVTPSNLTPVVGTAITLSAQAKDGAGNIVSGYSGKTVTFTRTNTAIGTLSSSTATTDANGLASVTLTVTATTGVSSTISVSDNGTPVTSGTSASIVSIPVPTKYLVTTSNDFAPAGGTITVSAQLASSANAAVAISGRTVTWSSTSTGPAGSFNASTSTTNSSGVATVSFTVSSDGGLTHTVTATDGSGAIAGTTSPTGASGSPIVGTSGSILTGISLVNASPVVPGNANTTSLALVTPSGLRSGDIMIAVLGTSCASCTISAATFNPPTGWAVLSSLDASDNTTKIRQIVYYKFATGSGDGSQTVTWTYPSGRTGGIILAYRNVDESSIVDVQNITVATVTGASTPYTMSVPSVTTTKLNGRVLGFFEHNDGNGQVLTAGTGNTLLYRYDSQGSNGTGSQSGGQYVTFLGQQRYKVAIGATGVTAATSGLTGTFVGMAIVLHHTGF